MPRETARQQTALTWRDVGGGAAAGLAVRGYKVGPRWAPRPPTARHNRRQREEIRLALFGAKAADGEVLLTAVRGNKVGAVGDGRK